MSKKLKEPEMNREYKFFYPPTKTNPEPTIHVFTYSGFKSGNDYLMYELNLKYTSKMSPKRFDFLMNNQKIDDKKTEKYVEPVLMHLQEGESEQDYARIKIL